MAYTKTVWENSPSTNTPINATNLNKIENELEFLDGNSSWFFLGNTIYYKKVGNLVTIRGLSLNEVALDTNDYKTLATLPESIRPSMELAFPWSPIGQDNAGLVRIYTNGSLALYSTNATPWWAFTITYVI